MAYETIILKRTGAVAIIRINRPDKLNAMNAKVKEEITHALGDLESDGDVRVAIITGVGDKAFVAGADIAEFAGKTPVDQWQAYGHTSLYNVVERFPKPILAMINGYCLGGGCELAMACDIRIASDRAQLGQPEINIGIIPGGGGSQRLPRLVGLGKALQLILTGDRIDARTAKEIGLVDEVVPHEALEAKTLELANKIAEKSPVAVRLAKAAVKASTNLPLDQGLRYEQSLFSIAFSTEDKEEGVRAFLEKRKPAFKGR
ncbi:MAG: enoyl-CoA hydratase/isomerase family protein [Euryarchaeota archaeon]|nr:enoyl-CoA hydratase/isomerase family protein [Euryarchaeota archaeon]